MRALEKEFAIQVRKKNALAKRRPAVQTIPRWLFGIPKLPDLPVIELRLRSEHIHPGLVELAETVELPRLPRVTSTQIARPRRVFD